MINDIACPVCNETIPRFVQICPLCGSILSKDAWTPVPPHEDGDNE